MPRLCDDRPANLGREYARVSAVIATGHLGLRFLVFMVSANERARALASPLLSWDG